MRTVNIISDMQLRPTNTRKALMKCSSLAADYGVTHNTIKSRISVLEASYIMFQLRPHHENALLVEFVGK